MQTNLNLSRTEWMNERTNERMNDYERVSLLVGYP